MALVQTYPSIPNLLVAWWPTVVGDLSVKMAPGAISTDLPASYENTLPFVRVTRLGGPRRLGLDVASVRLETFAASYDDAETIANELSSLIEWNLHSFSDGAGRVLTAECTAAPYWMPWDDQGITRFMGIYRLTVGALH